MRNYQLNNQVDAQRLAASRVVGKVSFDSNVTRTMTSNAIATASRAKTKEMAHQISTPSVARCESASKLSSLMGQLGNRYQDLVAGLMSYNEFLDHVDTYKSYEAEAKTIQGSIDAMQAEISSLLPKLYRTITVTDENGNTVTKQVIVPEVAAEISRLEQEIEKANAALTIVLEKLNAQLIVIENFSIKSSMSSYKSADTIDYFNSFNENEFLVNMQGLKDTFATFNERMNEYANSYQEYLSCGAINGEDANNNRVAGELKEFYEAVNQGYSNIHSWWNAYIENIEALEDALSEHKMASGLETGIRAYATYHLADIQLEEFKNIFAGAMDVNRLKESEGVTTDAKASLFTEPAKIVTVLKEEKKVDHKNTNEKESSEKVPKVEINVTDDMFYTEYKGKQIINPDIVRMKMVDALASHGIEDKDTVATILAIMDFEGGLGASNLAQNKFNYGGLRANGDYKDFSVLDENGNVDIIASIENGTDAQAKLMESYLDWVKEQSYYDPEKSLAYNMNPLYNGANAEWVPAKGSNIYDNNWVQNPNHYKDSQGTEYDWWYKYVDNMKDSSYDKYLNFIKNK